MQKLSLTLAIFIMGGCGIAYEYTLSKVSSDLLGNSVQQWALVIAIMLFFMGVGAEVQQRLSDRHLISTLVLSQILLAFLGGLGPLFLITTFAWYPLHFSLVHYGLISVCGLLIGLEIPLITRLNEAFSSSVSRNLGMVLRMDYAGALLGGLFWTFLLIPRLTISQTALTLGLITLLGTAICLFAWRRQTRRFLLLLSLLLVTTFLCLWALLRADAWTLHAEQSLYRDQIIHSATSPYQRTVLTRSKNGTLRCYINGHLQFSSDDEHIYHELLVHPAMALAETPRDILILGGGDGLAAREVLKYPGVRSITLVDLDPVVTEMARTDPALVSLNAGSLLSAKLRQRHLPQEPTGEVQAPPVPQNSLRYLPSGKDHTVGEVQLLHLDASRFIAEAADQRYDVAILDFPDPSSPGLAKLYGLSFYGQLQQLLRPGGIILQQATSPWHARESFLCIGETMRAAGLSAVPLHANVPSFGDWGWWLAAQKEKRSEARFQSDLDLITAFPVPTRYLSGETFQAARVFAPGFLEISPDSPISITTLNDPAIFRYYARAWQDSQ